jgi:hypothetical protein
MFQKQYDDEEKVSQVMLMEEIYKSCASCWLWLGEAKSKNETETAIVLLKNWASGQHLNINVNFNSTGIKIATGLIISYLDSARVHPPKEPCCALQIS